VTETPPAFLLSCARDDACERRVPVFDPNIETIAPPLLKRTTRNDMDEENTALWLSYRMRRDIKPRTLRHWRDNGYGPPYESVKSRGQHKWYNFDKVEEWFETCGHEPDLAIDF
jgi:hypothetical protein